MVVSFMYIVVGSESVVLNSFKLLVVDFELS